MRLQWGNKTEPLFIKRSAVFSLSFSNTSNLMPFSVYVQV